MRKPRDRARLVALVIALVAPSLTACGDSSSASAVDLAHAAARDFTVAGDSASAPADLASASDLSVPAAVDQAQPDLLLPDLAQPDLAPSCSDGVKNGDETDVDCGGSRCALCVAGKACGTVSDCASGLVCTALVACEDRPRRSW